MWQQYDIGTGHLSPTGNLYIIIDIENKWPDVADYENILS